MLENNAMPKTTTSYWGFRELTTEETDLISGGDAYSDCIADGDGVSDCIPTVTIEGERGPVQVDFAYDTPIPVTYTFISAPKTPAGFPPTTKEQQEEYCTYLAQKTWDRVVKLHKDGEIPTVAFYLISETRVKNEAKAVCLDSFKKST